MVVSHFGENTKDIKFVLAHKYKFDSGAAGPQVDRSRTALHPATTGRN
jgi:hypothetical protein